MATLISDTTIATTLTLPQSHDTQKRDRNIALSHCLLAALPHSITNDPVLLNIARAYIQDIAHSNPAHINNHTNLPPSFHDLVIPGALNFPTPSIPNSHIVSLLPYIDETDDPLPPLTSDSSDDDHDNDDEPPSLHSITDDEHNTITRRSTLRTPKLRAFNANHLLYDIRAATHNYESDSTHTNPEPQDESVEDHLPFWPEHAPPTPPLPDPNPPSDLNDAQIV